MLGGVGIGAYHQHAPVGEMRERGPDFLAVDDELVALELGAGAGGGEVRTGVRFREALAPDLFAAQNLRQEELFLFVSPVEVDRWPGAPNPPHVERAAVAQS